MGIGNRRRWLAGLLLLCGASLGTRWALGPAPAVQELRQRISHFPTRFPLRLIHSGTYRLTSDLKEMHVFRSQNSKRGFVITRGADAMPLADKGPRSNLAEPGVAFGQENR